MLTQAIRQPLVTDELPDKHLLFTIQLKPTQRIFLSGVTAVRVSYRHERQYRICSNR